MNITEKLHSNYKLTSHAQRVAQQRGVSKQTVECILYNADVRKHRGEGKMSFTISKKKLKQLQAQGYPPKTIEKVQAVVVLVEPLDRKVISVWHSFKKSGRRDYKQRNTFS